VPRSAREAVMGLTPAAWATSARVTRPVARERWELGISG
jgi:ABC-type phosphate transport system permease subunit